MEKKSDDTKAGLSSVDLSAMRRMYPRTVEPLLESDAVQNPFDMFHLWFSQAIDQSKQTVGEVNDFCLVTSTPNGRPSGRMMQLKSYDPVDGFGFFTNYQSRKAKELEQNPYSAMVFLWDYQSVRRQIRIEGRCRLMSAQQSDRYFGTRPRAAQISSRISRQSAVVDSRQTLLKWRDDETAKWEGRPEVPRPDYWGGYLLQPDRFEFWQGQTDRLHDRIVFEQSNIKNEWIRFRIQP